MTSRLPAFKLAERELTWIKGRRIGAIVASAFRRKENTMKLQLISASIVAYAMLATAWICQANLARPY